VPPRQLQRRFEDGVTRRPDPRLRETARGFRIEQHAQRAELCDQRARQLDRGAAANARAEQQSKQFRVRERVCPALEQFLAWPLGTGPVADGHSRGF
jgi:hypothetical protein